MSRIFAVSVFLFGSLAWGYPCPRDMENVRTKSTLYNWLAALRGLRMVEGCKIEITTCNPSEPRTDSQILGEVYVVETDGHQREAYLPLIIAAPNNPKIQTRLESFTRRFHYTKWDYFYEPMEGQTETYRLDVRMTADGLGMHSLDLGVYATNKATNSPDGNQSRWYNCGQSDYR